MYIPFICIVPTAWPTRRGGGWEEEKKDLFFFRARKVFVYAHAARSRPASPLLSLYLSQPNKKRKRMSRQKRMTVVYYVRRGSKQLYLVEDLPGYDPDCIDLQPTCGYHTTIDYVIGDTELRICDELHNATRHLREVEGRIEILGNRGNRAISIVEFEKRSSGELRTRYCY